MEHVRHFAIGGITVRVESELPMNDSTFHRKFDHFRVAGSGPDTVLIRHHFGLPDKIPACDERDGAREVYRRAPWAIFRLGTDWIYHGISVDPADRTLHRLAVFNAGHSVGDIFNTENYERAWLRGGLGSLTMFPTDQILLARLLADRSGCMLHSGALTVDGKGLVFVGHSEAGKSTTISLVQRRLGARMEILCDDRNIVRWWPQGRGGQPAGFYVHGTWSHGDIPHVSSASAPLHAVLFLEQQRFNEIAPLSTRSEAARRLLVTLVRPLVTSEWWGKEVDLVDRLTASVPCYTMRFDKSGDIVPLLERLLP